MQCSRQWIVIWLFFACVLITYATEIPPQRLALLRGTIALAKGDESALPDLMQAALLAPEEWRIQMLYGEALAQSGEKTLAKGQFRRAALLAPWRPEPWQTIIDFAHANGDKQLEYAGLAGLMRIFPENVVLRSHLADLYRALGQLDAAKKLDASWQADLPPLTFTASYPLNGHTATLAELRDLTQQQPEKIEILAALATEEWRAGNGMGVYNALTKQLQLTPTDLPTIYNLAHICFMLKHVDEGIQVLCTAPVGDKFADQNIAAWLIANNHYADALPPLQRLLQQNPTDPVLNRQLGVISLLTGDTATAITALRTAWDNGSDDLTAQAYIIALLQAGKPQDAEEIAKRALQQFPHEYMLHIITGLLYRDTGRLEEAADMTNLAASYRPETVELSVLAAERYIAAGKYYRAEAIAKRLRDDYPSDLVAMHGTVQLFRALCETPDAVLTLTRYFGPSMPTPLTRPQMLLEIARYALNENRLEEATAALNEIMRIDPKFRQAYDLLGTLYLQQQHWTNAIAVYQTARKYWPNDTEMTLALARTALQAGNIPLAIATFKDALQLTDSSDTWSELGEAYSRIGDIQQARNAWQQAITRQPGNIRAYHDLYISYLNAADPHAVEVLSQLLTINTAERTRIGQQWHSALSERNLAASAEEIDTLLNLYPQVMNPVNYPLPRVSQN